jgi:hypothetical protein
MALRQKTNNLLRVIKNFIIVLVRYVHAVIKFIRRNFSQLSKYLVGKKLIVFVIFLLIGFGFISWIALVPGTHIFEGNLVVEEMSFIYNGQQPKLFLQSIRHLKSLETEGIQTLNLTGKFETQAFPQLNKIKSLKINSFNI